MLGTPSLTAKAMVIGERVQNFRCRQPEGSGSRGKLCPKSITVTTGLPSGFPLGRARRSSAAAITGCYCNHATAGTTGGNGTAAPLPRGVGFLPDFDRLPRSAPESAGCLGHGLIRGSQFRTRVAGGEDGIRTCMGLFLSSGCLGCADSFLFGAGKAVFRPV